jgi:hypothetical protein
MNTETDTPRTDACWDDESCNILLHARQLEQELNEVTLERNNLDASLTAAISSSNARHFESMEHEAKSKQLERELNEAIKQRDGLHELHNKNAARSAELLDLCQTMRQQRNALTEALISAQGALNPLSGFTKIKGNRYLQIVRDKVREALETTKGEKP